MAAGRRRAASRSRGNCFGAEAKQHTVRGASEIASSGVRAALTPRVPRPTSQPMSKMASQLLGSAEFWHTRRGADPGLQLCTR